MELRDVTELIVDSEHKTAIKQDTGYPYIRTPNIGEGRLILDDVQRISKESYKEWTRRAVPQKNDLILAREAPVGNVAIITDGIKPCLGQRTVLIRPDPQKINSEYLVYLMLGDEIQERFYAVSTGATVPHLNMSDIRGLELPELPSLETQVKIASTLSVYDDFIENNSRRIETLEEMARLIYREWFVHFRYPGHEDDKLVDSGTELGEIPEGWEVQELGDIYKVKSGFAFRSKNLSDEGPYGIIKIKNVNDNEVDIGNVEYHHEDIPERAEKYKLSYDDMLITMTGYVGRVARMPKTSTTYYVNQRVGKFIPKVEDKDYKNYICGVLKSEKYQDKIENLAYGAAQPNLSATNAHGLEIAIPTEEIVEEYDKVIQPLYDMQHQLRAKNRKLKETRDLLLPKIISGKIKVEEVQV